MNTEARRERDCVRRQAPIGAALGMCLLLALALPACTRTNGEVTEPPGTPVPLWTSPHLSPAMAESLFAQAGAHLQLEGGREAVTLTCTVVEGTFCWYGDDLQTGGISREVARQVIDEHGARAIEQAKDNQVTLRCSRDAVQASPVTCEADWGWGGGWEPLAVE